MLAGSTITNSGPTVVTGDVGLNPGSQITGFEGAPSGGFVPGSGTARTDPGVGIAKRSLTKAYNAAASQTPQLPPWQSSPGRISVPVCTRAGPSTSQ